MALVSILCVAAHLGTFAFEKEVEDSRLVGPPGPNSMSSGAYNKAPLMEPGGVEDILRPTGAQASEPKQNAADPIWRPSYQCQDLVWRL